MDVDRDAVSLAYTYAWWLTGDADAARAAVVAAAQRPPVQGGDPDLNLELLLRRVRGAAIGAPTMCPASELALLHDGIGLGLDVAAGLAMVDAKDARTELAHGRLEALDADAQFEITEPQRLGGLAVGNPADVAAARQNPKLAQLRKMILEGRDELVTLSRIEVPPDLMDELGVRPADGGERPVTELLPDDADDWFREADQAHSSAEDRSHETRGGDAPGGTDDSAAGPLPPSTTEIHPLLEEDGPAVIEEIDLTRPAATSGKAARRAGREQRSIRPLWLLLGLAALLGVGTLLLTNADLLSPGTVDVAPVETPQPTDPDDGGDAPSDAGTPTDPAPEPTPTPDALEITGAGVAVGIGSDPDPDNPTAGPFDPVSFTIEYAGASLDDRLDVDWTVDDEPFLVDEVELSALLSLARFSRQVPEDGWPVGQHVLTFTLARTGEAVGTTRFTVVGDATEAGEEAEEQDA